MQIIHTLLTLLLVIIAIIFAIMNSENIILHYYFNSVTMPLSLALACAICLGSLLGIIASLKTILKLKYKQKHLKHELELAKQQIANLRELPLRDQSL
jgi:putative membrane protein